MKDQVIGAVVGIVLALILISVGALVMGKQQCEGNLEFQKKAERYFANMDAMQYLNAQNAKAKGDTTGTVNQK